MKSEFCSEKNKQPKITTGWIFTSFSDLAGTRRTLCMLSELSAGDHSVIIGSPLKHFDGSELGVNNYLFIRSPRIACRNKCLSRCHHLGRRSPTPSFLPCPPSLPHALLPPSVRQLATLGAEQGLMQSVVSQSMLPATWDEEERSPARILLPGLLVQMILLSHMNWEGGKKRKKQTNKNPCGRVKKGIYDDIL